MLQSSIFCNSIWSINQARLKSLKWSKYGPDNVPNAHIRLVPQTMLTQFWKFQSSGLSDISWSLQGPYMTLTMLTCLQNSRALGGLKVKLGQAQFYHGPNMALTWSQKLDSPQTDALEHVDLVWKISELYMVQQ